MLKSIRKQCRSLAAAAIVAVAGVAVTGVAPADAKPRVYEKGDRGSAVKRIQSALGIPADGIYGKQTRRAVRRFQHRHGLAVDGIVGPATFEALGLSRAREAKAVTGVRLLEAIARCESGGNPRAVSPNGRYRGKYQFSRATWRGLGGKGDPAKAPEAEQDRRAAALLASDGVKPWPTCGRKARAAARRR